MEPPEPETSASATASPGEVAEPSDPLTKEDFEALARFRFGIRRYLRFSEETVRSHGVTPQQYQLMLAVKGFPGRDWAVVRELAERLQLRHHSVVELVDRAVTQRLVHRATDPDDARAVRVTLSDRGERLLARLSALHRDELRRMDDVLTLPRWHAQGWHGLSTSTPAERQHDDDAEEDPPLVDGVR
jgi:DNA-binding MarR family transcriptional regulator